MMCSRTLTMISAPVLAFWAATTPLPAQSQDFEGVAPAEDALSVADGEIHARLMPNGCEHGFEAACSITHQLQRSEWVSTHPQHHGERYSYKWDILVPEDFVYTAPGAYLRAGRFFDTSGESFFSFLLDGSKGYHVSRKVCFGPEAFGQWHSIEMRVAWDSTKKTGIKDKTPGEIRVLCDGREVLSRSGRPNLGPGEEAWLALGLMGAITLAEGDNAAVAIRNVEVVAR